MSPGVPLAVSDPTLPAGPPLAEALREKTVRFAHLLRNHGFSVGLRETEDSLRVAEVFLCFDFDCFHVGLRTLFCLSRDQFERFDGLFDRYWRPRDASERISPQRALEPHGEPRRGEALLQTLGWAEEPTEAGETEATAGASGLDALRKVDFSHVPAEWAQELEALAARLYRRMRVRRPSRRRGPDFRRRLHLRRMLRRSLATGGEPLEIILQGRRRRRPRLVVLLDVSGSMEAYSYFFLRFLHALQHRFRKVHTFLFSTRLEDVTEALAARDVDAAMAKLARRPMGWNAGTRIGDCLRWLVRGHGDRVFRADTVFVILSDGLDVGEPAQLAAALREVRARSRRIVWLNPLLGIEGYAPLAQGMAAALPWLDVFAPAHNLESLLELEGHVLI